MTCNEEFDEVTVEQIQVNYIYKYTCMKKYYVSIAALEANFNCRSDNGTWIAQMDTRHTGLGVIVEELLTLSRIIGNDSV